MHNSLSRERKGWVKVLISILPYFFIMALFQYAGSLLADADLAQLENGTVNSTQFFIINAVGLVGTILALSLLTRFLDKKSLSSLGFTKWKWVPDVLLGLVFGAVIMFLGFLLLKQSGQVSVESIRYDGTSLLLTIGIFTIVAFAEEMYFRGYVLNNLMESFNKYVALALSSLFFAIVHVFNPNFSFLSFVSIFLAGIFLGLSYIFTRSLWFPLALHFSWNFFQSFFGFNVSGVDTYSLFNTRINVETIWNGGKFGFENSALAILFQLIAITLVYYLFRKRSPGLPVNPADEKPFRLHSV